MMEHSCKMNIKKSMLIELLASIHVPLSLSLGLI